MAGPLNIVPFGEDSEHESDGLEDGEVREVHLYASQSSQPPLFEDSSSQELAAVALAAAQSAQAEDASPERVVAADSLARAAAARTQSDLQAAQAELDAAVSALVQAVKHEKRATSARIAAENTVTLARTHLAMSQLAASVAYGAVAAATDAVRRASWPGVEAQGGAGAAQVSSTRLFVFFAGSKADVDDTQLLAVFAPYAARCVHIQHRAHPKRAFASVHIAGDRKAAVAAKMATNGMVLGPAGNKIEVDLAPRKDQTPCSRSQCVSLLRGRDLSPSAHGISDEPHEAQKRPRLLAVQQFTPPQSPAARDASPAAGCVRKLAIVSSGAPHDISRLAGVLIPTQPVSEASDYMSLFALLQDPVRGHPVEQEQYAHALALAADAAVCTASHMQAHAKMLGCYVWCTPQNETERALLASLRGTLSTKTIDEEWRCMLLPADTNNGTVAELPPPGGLFMPRRMHVRLCNHGMVRKWMDLLSQRVLALALDLDETVVKAYREHDLHQLIQQMRDEDGHRANARLRTAEKWLDYLHAFAQQESCPALARYAQPWSMVSLGGGAPNEASTQRPYTAFCVPGGLREGLPGDCALVRVAGEPLLVCIRPGWPALRAVLQKCFWTSVATHASLEYACEMARLLDPGLYRVNLLRSGGEGAHDKWQMLQIESSVWGSNHGSAAQEKPLLAHIASFRREMYLPAVSSDEDAPMPPLQLIQKSFGALSKAQPCCNAFVALDDLIGGREAGSGVWTVNDSRRVLCPPPFRPFARPQPGDDRVLERCAEALLSVHSAFFQSAGHCSAARLADLVQQQEARMFGTSVAPAP